MWSQNILLKEHYKVVKFAVLPACSLRLLLGTFEIVYDFGLFHMPRSYSAFITTAQWISSEKYGFVR